MSVSILNVPGNDAARIFVFEGQAPSFPYEEYEFTDRNDANISGYFVAANLLANPRSVSVKVLRSDMIPEYIGRGSWDCVEVTLREAFLWNSLVKATSDVTVAQRYAQVLQAQFFDGSNRRYQDPSGQNENAAIVAEVNGHLKKALQEAASTGEELTHRRNAGYRPTVFDTLKIDKGNVQATSYANGVLTSVFSGKCASDCVSKSTLATETSIQDMLRPIYPFIKQYVFIAR